LRRTVTKDPGLSSGLNMKLTVTLSSGEKVSISRRYRDELLDRIHEMAREGRQ